MDRAADVLATQFGFPSFRDGQKDIVEAVLHGNDVVGVMPTGGGKSLCYQVPAVVFPACTLVVSPLIALMLDQVRGLTERGIKAAALHSDLPTDVANTILLEAQRGSLKLLYVSPERLENEQFRLALLRVPLSLLAIDEAHCISEWGHDFRPAYRSIMKLFESRQRVPVIAVTATATPEVRNDIVASLGLTYPKQVIHGFDRPNLAFSVVNTPHKIEAISKRVLENPEDSVIVYAGSRKRVEEIASELQKRRIAAEPYHAGIPHVVRSETQNRFHSDTTRVLVATNAFGMGVDKSNIRAVIHVDLTLTLEAYYQEAGRAGRDGAEADCILLYQTEDRGLMDFFISSTYPDSSAIRLVAEYLYDRSNVLVGGTPTGLIQADAANIAADLHKPLATVRGVLAVLERAGVLAQVSLSGIATMRLLTSQQRLHEFIAHAPASRSRALAALERAIAQTVHTTAAVPLDTIIRQERITPIEMGEAIRSLQAARIVAFLPAEKGGGVMLLKARPISMKSLVDLDAIRVRRERAEQKRDLVIRYAETSTCKRNTILEYFGEHSNEEGCGRCSSCLSKGNQGTSRVEMSEIAAIIVRTAHELNGRFGRHVIADVVTGTVSERVLDYRLTDSKLFQSGSSFTRSRVLNEIAEAITHGWIDRSTGEYPTIRPTELGAELAAPMPAQISVTRVTLTQGVHKKVYAELMALRERISEEEDSSALSVLSNESIEKLATDCPRNTNDLIPGKHGSGVVIARYADQITSVIRGVFQVEDRAVPKIRLDADIERVVKAITPDRTVEDISRVLRMSPANVARSIQRALEMGALISVGTLVPEEAFIEIQDYMREHRFAKLKHVQNDVQPDVDLPTLRVAIAFARQQLFGAT